MCPVVFSALSLLYQGISNWWEKKLGSENREFAIPKVCYIERIYKTFVRAKWRELDFGLQNRYARYIGGSQYRESIAFQYVSSNIVHGQIHEALCSTHLLNNKKYNKCFLTICLYRLWSKRESHFCKSTQNKAFCWYPIYGYLWFQNDLD